MDFPKLKCPSKYSKIGRKIYNNEEEISNFNLNIVGKGKSRYAIKIPKSDVNEVEGRWDCPYGYCLKIADKSSQAYSDGKFQNEKEYHTYTKELTENMRQFFSPIFQKDSEFLWVLQPYMKDIREKDDINLFCNKIRSITGAKDINEENVKVYKDSLYVIDYGFGINWFSSKN